MAKQAKIDGVRRRIPFAVRLDRANEVILSGDFNAWSLDQIRLVRAGDNLWTTTLELPPGEYQYRLLVDGEWRNPSEANRRVPNAFGSENCVLVVQ
jgi:1,4-alpha-glucan branching enzyme